MSSFSDYLENEALDWAFTANVVTRPTSWSIALYTAAPSDSGGGTEVTGGSYARTAATFSVTGDTASNTGNVDFPTATASWGTVTHMGIFDQSSNFLAWAPLTASKTVDTGDLLRFSTGQLTITLA